MNRAQLAIIVLALLALTLGGCQCGGRTPSILDLSTPWGDLDIGGSNAPPPPPPPAAKVRQVQPEPIADASDP